jgi:uncharacterized protein (TIGR02145 family)
VDASGASTYQWLENGSIIPNTSAPTYIVPNNKAAGLYTYIRQSKSADCSEWQSSNVFTVTVYACSFTAGTETGATATFTDPRDGKRYKTVVMPDGKTWFAQNLNYTKDLTYNAYAYEANGKQFTPNVFEGTAAVGSYWCPGANESVVSGTEAECRTYGALYTWETSMMVDGKYADEAKTSSAWDESWVSPYYFATGALNSNPNADRNNARGGTNVKGGGRGICPMGWHVPTLLEWATLFDAVEESPIFTSGSPENAYRGTSVGQALKSSKTYTGNDDNTGSWLLSNNCVGTDAFGFAAVPAGWLPSYRGYFTSRGYSFIAYSSTTPSVSSGNYVRVHHTLCGGLFYGASARHALSIRCIKD